jgi:hypothetical protein
MIFLFLALLFQFTVYNRLVVRERESAPIGGKIAAGVALFLWFGVGLAGCDRFLGIRRHDPDHER